MQIYMNNILIQINGVQLAIIIHMKGFNKF